MEFVLEYLADLLVQTSESGAFIEIEILIMTLITLIDKMSFDCLF
jgi:hypothetical protein